MRLKSRLLIGAVVKNSHINKNEMGEHVARMGGRSGAYRVLVGET